MPITAFTLFALLLMVNTDRIQAFPPGTGGMKAMRRPDMTYWIPATTVELPAAMDDSVHLEEQELGEDVKSGIETSTVSNEIEMEDYIPIEQESPKKSLIRPQFGALEMLNYYLTVYPNRTKITLSALLGALGDLVVQYYASLGKGRFPGFDYRRMTVFTVVCGFYFAPLVNVWFEFLNSLKMPDGWSKSRKALAMVAIDQTVGSCVVKGGFYMAFEVAQRLVPGGSFETGLLEAGIASTRAHYWPTLKANWYCWPFANYINFFWIPAQYRLLFTSFVSIFWNMYLSSIANSKK
mmetsp:Transcript_1842/g.2933  ORF Transcript_1842/g.2933 Transcript_1842/m.2933 type:complete len:294 (+) Transcript_1842:209-1090(+)